MSEVKRFSPEYCEAGGVGWAEMQEDAEGAWCKASDYDALAAEFKELAERYAKLQTGEDGLVSRVVAELTAIRAAGGEEVEVVAITEDWPNDSVPFAAVLNDAGYELPTGAKLMTLAQHQRIVVAMAAELEGYRQDTSYDVACETIRKLRAELEAARKQSPIGHVALGSHTGVVFYSHMPQLPDGTKLYALPPLAGQVSVRRELLERVSAVLNRLDVLPEPFDEAAELRALLAGQQADGCPICKQRNYIQRKIDEAEA